MTAEGDNSVLMQVKLFDISGCIWFFIKIYCKKNKVDFISNN